MPSVRHLMGIKQSFFAVLSFDVLVVHNFEIGRIHLVSCIRVNAQRLSDVQTPTTWEISCFLARKHSRLTRIAAMFIRNRCSTVGLRQERMKWKERSFSSFRQQLVTTGPNTLVNTLVKAPAPALDSQQPCYSGEQWSVKGLEFTEQSSYTYKLGLEDIGQQYQRQLQLLPVSHNESMRSGFEQELDPGRSSRRVTKVRITRERKRNL